MELKAITSSEDVIVQLEDDGYVGTFITCRCPVTGISESYDFMASYFDRYRDDEGVFRPFYFAQVSQVLADDFVNSMRD